MTYSAPIDEQKLITDLRDRNLARAAFDTLMRTYGEKMYWQIRKLVISHDDAADVLQNSFLKAWKNIDHFRGDAKLSTWLCKIAINESIDFLKRQRTRMNIQGEDDSYLTDNLESDPYFDGDEVKQRLLKAVAALPEKQRLVFNMRYFDEMKYEKISEILGTSVGALKASYHHAVKKVTEAVTNI